jgi:predicted phosphodiesterase
VRRLEQADLILHAGDFTASSVLEELERYAPVAAVFGNMDEPARAATRTPRRRGRRRANRASGSPTERRRAPEHTMILLRVDASGVEPELVRL